MSWLLGIGASIGIANSAVLAILIYHQSKSNRSDLHRLVQAIKDLGDARRDNDGHKQIIENLESTLSLKTDELTRTRKALESARKALSNAYKRLDRSGVTVGDVSSSLKWLSEDHSMSKAIAPEDDNG